MMTSHGWFLVFCVSFCMNDVIVSAQDAIVPPNRMNRTVDFFDCRRHGQNCFNGGSCDYEAGICRCPSGTTNYDCSVSESQRLAPASCPGCKSPNGMCVRNPMNQAMCVCNEQYEGVTCEEPRVPVKLYCNDVNMQISYFPYPMSRFEGRIFIDGGERDPACYFQQKPSTPISEFTLLVPLEQKCGYGDKGRGKSTSETPTVKTETYTRMIIIQHHPFITSALDESFEVTCVYKEGVYNHDGMVTRISYDEMTSFQSGGITHMNYDAGSLMTMDVLTKRGELVQAGQPVTIGAELQLSVAMHSNGMFRFRVESCVATDGVQGGITQPMVTAGCIDPSAKGIVFPFIGSPTTAVLLPFEAFKFSSSDMVVFICTVKVCSNFAQCDPYNCDLSGVVAQTRSRRSVDDHDDDQRAYKLTRTITISKFLAGDEVQANASEIAAPAAATNPRTSAARLPLATDDCRENEKTFRVLMYTFGAGTLIAAFWSVSMGCLLSPRCQRSRN